MLLVNLQEAGGWGGSTIIAAATATATDGSITRYLHAEQSWSSSKCRIHHSWIEQYLQSAGNSGFWTRRDCYQVLPSCTYFRIADNMITFMLQTKHERYMVSVYPLHSSWSWTLKSLKCYTRLNGSKYSFIKMKILDILATYSYFISVIDKTGAEQVSLY